MISVVLTAVLSVYLAELHDEKYYHLIICYYGLASLYGFGAYEAAYLHKNPQYPVLCSVAYVLFYVPKKIFFVFQRFVQVFVNKAAAADIPSFSLKTVLSKANALVVLLSL